MDDRNILEVKNLEVHFEARSGFLNNLLSREVPRIRAVDGVNFNLKKGEILSLAGESGCGKTTTGKAILRLVEPTGGKVYFRGQDLSLLTQKELREFRQQAQIIFQDPYESLNPRQTVFATVAEPLEVNRICDNTKEKEERVARALSDAGLKNPRDYFIRYPHELSGGQRQRIAIASALVLKPKFIVADEPVTMLDLSIRSGILKLMMELRDNKQISYLFITHDLSLAWLISDRIAVMYSGNIVEIGGAEQIIGSPAHPYTKALVSVIPNPERSSGTDRKLLEGEIPDPSSPPRGCKFHPRCSYAQPCCREERPLLREVEKDRFVSCHLV